MATPKKRLLFVCLGNICRSPTAHGIMQQLINEAGLQQSVYIDSAGTYGAHEGEAPDQRSQNAALVRGYDLSFIRSRKLIEDDYLFFDYIFPMDKQNLAHMQAHCPEEHLCKLSLLLQHGNSNQEEVPDPYYGGSQGFKTVIDLVENACQAILSNITKK